MTQELLKHFTDENIQTGDTSCTRLQSRQGAHTSGIQSQLPGASAPFAGCLPGTRARPAPWPCPHFRSCALRLRRDVLTVMAASRLPPVTLTLKQFIRRQQVLLLYRRILQAIRQVPNDCDRKYLKDWAREEFKRNKSATEEVRTRSWTQSG
nr:LYR motif-containing protein 2 isoform X2 [Loxodonta africana]